jgi:hypothetical protein
VCSADSRTSTSSPEAIGLLTGGVLRVADLTSELVGIGEAPDAFERWRDAITKILIAPNGL